MQLMLEPGFSTAGSVTQQAGRGVGMDVVATEIKTARRLAAHGDRRRARARRSRSGCRSRWRSAMRWWCAPGDEYYALPLPTVEGVLRLSHDRSRPRIWAATAPTFDQSGQKYRFQHLAAFVGLEPSPLPEGDVTMPWCWSAPASIPPDWSPMN